MEPGKWVLEEALAAIESETRHLVHSKARSTPTAETDMDIAPLVHKVGATSIAEIEKLIGELQEARDFLQSEGEGVRRETERALWKVLTERPARTARKASVPGSV
jgi:hypothetical protein